MYNASSISYSNGHARKRFFPKDFLFLAEIITPAHSDIMSCWPHVEILHLIFYSVCRHIANIIRLLSPTK